MILYICKFVKSPQSSEQTLFERPQLLDSNIALMAEFSYVTVRGVRLFNVLFVANLKG
jgi:hypothetical protein